MEKRPFLCVGLAAFFAALFCSFLTPERMLILIGATGALLFLAIVFLKDARGKVTRWMCLSALLMASFFLAKELTVVYPQLALDGQTVTVTARLEELSSDGTVCTVKAEGGDLDNGMRLLLLAGDEPIIARRGDLVEGELRLAAAFDRADLEEARYQRANGIYLLAWPTSSLDVIDGQDSLSRFDALIYSLRDGIKETMYRFLPEREAGLCVSVLIGDREGLSAEIEGAFRANGVYHLLAVSGMHLTVIVGALWWMLGLFDCRRGVKTLSCMTAVVLFAAVCGFTASVVRAAVMTLIVLSSGLFRRAADGLNSIGFAAFAMLVFDPFCVFDLGWQLSFAATFGMFSWLPVWQREVTKRVTDACPRIRVLTAPVLTAVGVSIAAAAMTMPLTALYFGEVSTVFLIGNLGCVTPVSALLLICLSGIVLSNIPFLCTLVFRLADNLCDWVCFFTEWLSSWPFAEAVTEQPFLVLWLFALVILLSVGYVLLGMHGVRRVTALLLCVLFTVVTIANLLFGAAINVTPLGDEELMLLVTTADSTGVIMSGGTTAAEATQSGLLSRGIRQLDWLVWMTPPAADHINGAVLTVPSMLLCIAGDVAKYESFPVCGTVECLDSGDYVKFSDKGQLTRVGDRYYLQFGQTAMDICPFGTSSSGVTEGCDDPQLMILCSKVPDDFNGAVPLLICCDRRAVGDIMDDLPYGCEAYFAALGDVPTIISRGRGDILLRD